MNTISPKPQAQAQTLRPFYRRPAVLLLATAVASFAAGFRYKAAVYKKNEMEQKDGLYVSVDRSGGGV